MRLSLVIIFAATVGYGLGALKDGFDRPSGARSQLKGTNTVSESSPRLAVEDQWAFVNEPLSVAVRVEHAAENESLTLEGLAPGTTLSAGTAKSPSSWQLPSDKLRGLYLYAPKDFAGAMNTAVDLLGPNQRLLESRTMQLKWIPRQPMPATKIAPLKATTGDHPDSRQSPMPAIQPIDAGEAAILMRRGRDFLSNGDISGARVAFRRLAGVGNADGALALARTYDPDYLAAHNFLGMRGDRATARALYQRAKELGSAEAGRILAQMQ